MNGLDYAVLAVIAVGAVLGFSRGFVRQLLSVAGLVGAYLIAFTFYDDVAPAVRSVLVMSGSETYRNYEYLAKGLQLDTYVYNGLAFALLFFFVKIGFGIAGRLLNWLTAVPGIKQANQWSGAALGFAEAAVIALLAVQVMTVVPSDGVQKLLKTSVLTPYMLQQAPLLTNKLKELWEQRTVPIPLPAPGRVRV